MTGTVTRLPAPAWWDTESLPVRAVIDLAAWRPDATPRIHDRVLAAFAPAHADTIREIADELDWIDRCSYDNPADVLGDYYERPTAGSIGACEALADELRASALTSAQLVASLMRRAAP